MVKATRFSSEPIGESTLNCALIYGHCIQNGKLRMTCVKDWKIGIENCKHDPMGEDLFADIGMRKNGVTSTEVFDITKRCP